MRFKKMKDRTDLEIDQGINDALMHCADAGIDFWKLLTGIDSYFEKRKRKEENEKIEKAGITSNQTRSK